MTTINKLIAFLMTGALLLGGCGVKKSAYAPATPQEAAECIMESIKNLDMETFNQYTDNYIQTYHNWIGVPVEAEYQIFNELLQPQSKHSKRYQTSYKLAQKMMEKLTWEITQVRENGSTAEIDMAITNIDMLKVMDTYETSILENMLQSPGIGIIQLIKDTVAIKTTLISIIDNMDESDINTVSVTISAYQDNGQWKIHLSPDFIDAFFGNLYTNDSENPNPHIAELEQQAESKVEQWAEEFEDKVSSWAGQFE